MDNLFQILFSDAKSIVEKINFEKLKGKSIIITGASGLVGINLLTSLRIAFESIKDILIYPVIYSEPSPFLRELFNSVGIHYMQGDITDENFCSNLPEADYIIHAAGYAQPLKFMEDPLKTFRVNTCSTISLFKKLKQNGKFLFISSSEVYSGLNKNIFYENEIGNTNTTHPRACYIEGKKGGETIVNSLRTLGVNATSARLSLVYGPGTKSNDKRVLSSFIEKGLRGEIKLLDKGEAIRTYCYITDAVEILLNILIEGKEPIYNVGGYSIISIANLAKKIGEIINVPVIFPKQNEGIPGAPQEVRLDLSLIENEFKKHKFVNIEQGLENSINWYKNIKGFF